MRLEILDARDELAVFSSFLTADFADVRGFLYPFGYSWKLRVFS